MNLARARKVQTCIGLSCILQEWRLEGSPFVLLDSGNDCMRMVYIDRHLLDRILRSIHY